VRPRLDEAGGEVERLVIYYLSPTPVDLTRNLSGGTRKLWDHVAILNAHGRPARVIQNIDVNNGVLADASLVVIPEVYGWAMDNPVFGATPRVCFVQNAYLVSRWGIDDPAYHPFDFCEHLIAILTESAHSTDKILREYTPPVPVIRTHSSGNGRLGATGPFSFGPWPRQRWVMHFSYKVGHLNGLVYPGLDLPPGWKVVNLSGRTDEGIAAAMRTGAMFCAPNQEEGMCAPTSEAMISGCFICAWTGGGTEEYLPGRAAVAKQDDVDNLRRAIVDNAWGIEKAPGLYARSCEEASQWFQRTYSRKAEIEEICTIMDDLVAKATALR